jgi:tetratricopeptide (TPR) repeat protein
MNEAIQQRIVALEKKVGRDGKSPLFAQLANCYLETNRAKEALRICDAGLSHFPFYTTGHLIKGKALIALNMRAEARREFEFVLSFLPKNETVIYLLEHISPGEEGAPASTQEKKHPKAAVPEPSHPKAADRTYTIPSATPTPPHPEKDSNLDRSSRTAKEPLQTAKSITEVPSGSNFFDAITQTPPKVKTEDPFGFGVNMPTIEPPVKPEISQFGGFETLTPEPSPFPEVASPPKEQPDGFGDIPSAPEIIAAPPSAPIEEESFKDYAARRRAELTGAESISLEDYFNNVTSVLSSIEIKLETLPPELPTETQAPSKIQLPIEEPERIESSPIPVLSIDLPETPSLSTPFISFDVPQPAAEETVTNPLIDLPQSSPSPFIPPTPADEPDKIEELTAKLQTVKRITPVIDITPVINIAEKETPPPSQQDSPPIGFVTPTLAEIYAKQGWFDDAIKAYKTLVRTKPGEKERFERRIAELEEMKKQGGK